MQAGARKVDITQEDQMRADMYGLLGNILFVSPDQRTIDLVKTFSGDETDIGKAFDTLAKLAGSLSIQQISEEFDGLFIGMGRGELLPYGSYYLTGFLNEKPLAKLRNSMTRLGIARAEEVKEPEDHIGTLCEMMAGLITGHYGECASLEVQRDFYQAHIEPWAGHFFADLEAAKLSRFFQPVGTIGRLFTEIETNAFSME